LDKKELKEKVAMLIYYHEGGVGPDEYLEVMGRIQPHWNELAEWERDEYRYQAESVIKFLSYNGLLK